MDSHDNTISSGPTELTILYSSNNQPGNNKKKFNGVCSHYGIKGHKKEQFYRLIGFPADFKFNKKKGQMVQTSSNANNCYRGS